MLQAVLTIAYPAAVYFGLLHLSARSLGGLLLLFVLPGFVLRFQRAKREDLWAVLKVPLAIVALLALSAISGSAKFVLVMPVLINLVLLTGFGSSLRKTPMIERFARMQKPDLPEREVAYCRSVTLVWCVFFALNAALSAALAFFGSLRAWALYTGLVAYILIGALGSTEYIVRKYRFRDYGSGLHDRLLARVFPPRAAGREAP